MKPRPLPAGGTIGVAAASSPFEERSEIDRSVRWYEERGYRVKLADGVYARDDFVAGDAEARARDVNALFADPDVDLVQLLRGGYGASQVVPHLDFDLIGDNPKPLVGYSDVTALHVAIRQRTGLVTFYGPGFTGMGSSKRGDWSKERFLRAVGDPEQLGEIPPRPDDPYVGAIGGGRASAPLVGGCLWLLRETLATPWEVDLDDAILFFEDVHCPPWHVDGMLTQLRNAGKLNRIKGVAIGEMYKCEEWRQPEPWLRSRSMEDVFEHHLGPLDVPVVHNLPLGHGDHLCTIPLGVTATIDADAHTLVIEESALNARRERSRREQAPAASR
ncbi:MAG: LD-carboxypeptidase [Actinobacteria bacterium]|nr:LD-carboxypeptidase [Actinomycetota bacterium]